ncbi:MAG: hypothetical protein P8X95_26420 [Anaerolineales bacterium]|jgi:hypothetical protein
MYINIANLPWRVMDCIDYAAGLASGGQSALNGLYCGHSMGAAIVQRTATGHSDRDLAHQCMEA